ncbi:MAG: metallophosphoesterase [Selenomonadaceae bacterium]|nr:metallophosphoesterase [Selenomonadaceae bacterium]
MKIFLMITAIILLVIIGLTLISVGFLFNQKARRKIRISILIVDLILIATVVIGMMNRNLFSDELIEIFVDVMSVIFISQMICVVIVMLALIVRSIYRFFNKPAPFSRERRSMLAYGLFYPIFSLVTAIYANQVERNNEVENFFDIKIKNLPPELDGFKLAQISDIHLGAFFSLDRLEKLLTKILEAKPDILAITGDIFDNVEMNDEAIKLVDSFYDKFKFGIVYCHGNHEHRRDIQAIEKSLSQTKIHYLINSTFRIPHSELYFVGVDYPIGVPTIQARTENEQKNFDQRREAFLTKAMENVPKDSICILLAHHPEFIDDAIKFKIPLTLTGHTHGSQIGFFGVPLFPVFKYTRGMFINGDCYGYVHCGNGSWFPFRLGCPPEIAYFTLHNK